MVFFRSDDLQSPLSSIFLMLERNGREMSFHFFLEAELFVAESLSKHNLIMTPM